MKQALNVTAIQEFTTGFAKQNLKHAFTTTFNHLKTVQRARLPNSQNLFGIARTLDSIHPLHGKQFVMPIHTNTAASWVMGLLRTSWVKLNRLRTGVGRFHSSMYKWGVAPSPNCECGASEQTADHIISTCRLHCAPKGVQGLLVLDDDTRHWLKINAVNI